LAERDDSRIPHPYRRRRVAQCFPFVVTVSRRRERAGDFPVARLASTRAQIGPRPDRRCGWYGCRKVHRTGQRRRKVALCGIQLN
jgi:hypothetical protein